MRNIFLFIRRFSVFIGFMVLQVICLYLLFTYNKSHRAKGLGAAGAVTAYFNGKYNALEDFFTMQEENRRVHDMNDSLLNRLTTLQLLMDSMSVLPADSMLLADTATSGRYIWRNAQVLYSAVSSDKNYLQINKGSKQGIADDMGVFSSNGGLVGKVIRTGEQFSEVMSLLNVVNKLSVQMKRTGNSGMLSWDGKSPTTLTLSGIPKTDSVRRGDTVLTGNYSLSFPPGKMVGTVATVLKDKASNFLILKIKPAANLTNLQQVFVVENIHMQELKNLDQQAQDMVDKKGGSQ